MNNDELANHLCQKQDEELLEILKQVFRQRFPYPMESSYLRNHFFLGIASSLFEQETWSQWKITAIAYVDMETYPKGGQGPGFCQFGSCSNCGTAIASSAKTAICSICEQKNSLS